MAARIKKIKHDENTRLKIQAAQLINRLTNHANGEVEMSATQVRAIEILLRKILPDLSDVKMEVDTRPITFQLDMTGKKRKDEDE
jgi:hypothetical protein